MWSRLLLVLCINFISSDATGVVFCPQWQSYNEGCSTPVIVLLDASSDLESIAILQYMDFVFNNLLPHWAILGGQTVSHTSYGATLTAPRNPFTSVYQDTCYQLDDVQDDMFQYGGANVTLKQALVQLEANYQQDIAKYGNLNLLIFSGTNNADDINDAGAFVKSSSLSSVSITVVGLNGDYRPWTDFPAFQIETPTPRQIQNNELIRKALSCYTCGGCATPPNIWLPTATPPTLAPTSPLPPLTTPAPAPGTNGPQCDTRHSTLWLDIMFLLDASTGDGYDAMENMLYVIINELAAVEIVKNGHDFAYNFTTRIGVATYSNRTRIYGNLYTMDRYDLDDLKLYIDIVADTNLDDAITKMSAQFDDPTAHRPNAKKVIVIMGHEYKQGNYPDPVSAANIFKESGGVIVVYDYYGYDATLKAIASEGFYLQSQYDTRSMLIDALVNVNCFCPIGTVSFTNYGSSSIPTSGCYFVNGPSNYQVASNQCKKVNSGIIAQNKNTIKTQFLQLQDPSNIIWTGATLDSKSGTWKWADGTDVDMSSVNWVGPPQAGQNCAALNHDGRWLATDCRNSYDSVCEASPCGTSHYWNQEYKIDGPPENATDSSVHVDVHVHVDDDGHEQKDVIDKGHILDAAAEVADVEAVQKTLMDEPDDKLGHQQLNATPYLAMMMAFESNMDFILRSYGTQKAGFSKKIEDSNANNGGARSEAEGKRRYMVVCLENGRIPADVHEQRCVGSWIRISRKYRQIKVSQMTLSQIFMLDLITTAYWLREIVPVDRPVPIFEGIWGDVKNVRVKNDEKEGSVSIINRTEDEINLTDFSSTRLKELTNNRSRGQFEICAKGRKKAIEVEVAKASTEEEEGQDFLENSDESEKMEPLGCKATQQKKMDGSSNEKVEGTAGKKRALQTTTKGNKCISKTNGQKSETDKSVDNKGLLDDQKSNSEAKDVKKVPKKTKREPRKKKPNNSLSEAKMTDKSCDMGAGGYGSGYVGGASYNSYALEEYANGSSALVGNKQQNNSPAPAGGLNARGVFKPSTDQ